MLSAQKCKFYNFSSMLTGPSFHGSLGHIKCKGKGYANKKLRPITYNQKYISLMPMKNDHFQRVFFSNQSSLTQLRLELG